MFEFNRADKILELNSFCKNVGSTKYRCIFECPLGNLPNCCFIEMSDDELNVAWDLYCGNKKQDEV